MKTKHFINLTNGIQAIQDYNLTDVSFIRIKSTQCEQKRWEEIILTISDDFLMNVAMGNYCIVYDYGANKEVPRAVWQGLEWIKYCLSLRWYGEEYQPVDRAETQKSYFYRTYCELSRIAKRRLDYFQQYNNGPFIIQAITKSTTHDGEREYYQQVMRNFDISPLCSLVKYDTVEY